MHDAFGGGRSVPIQDWDSTDRAVEGIRSDYDRKRRSQALRIGGTAAGTAAIGSIIGAGAVGGVTYLVGRAIRKRIAENRAKEEAMAGGAPKTASADILPQMHQGAHTLAHQYYLPLRERRDFSPEETAMLDREASKVIPKVFQSRADSPAVKMYSPKTDATLLGTAGAVVGGLGGSMVGGMIVQRGDPMNHEGGNRGAAVGGVLGALLAGGVGAMVGYKRRQARNANVEESMRRLAPGATIRDYEADPLYQKELDRAVERLKARQTGSGFFRQPGYAF